MGMLDRRRRRATAAAIDDFWVWWQNPGRIMVETALARKEMVDAARELTRRTAAVGPGLEWHLGHGPDEPPSFTLSAANAPGQRPTAERWRRLAPAAGGWEFRSAKAAEPKALEQRLALPGASVDLREVTLTIDDTGRRIDVVVLHPAFGRVPPDAAQQVAFFVLDWLLGEDAVERWIGLIETASGPTGAPPARLADVIAEREGARDPDTWGVLQGQIDDRPVVALVRSHVDRFDHPTHDLHHAVTTRFPATADGLPVDVDALQVQEDAFDDIPGVVLAAVETHAGSRTLHLYSDGDDAAASAAVAAAARAAGRRIKTRPDPGWAAVRHLRPR